MAQKKCYLLAPISTLGRSTSFMALSLLVVKSMMAATSVFDKNIASSRSSWLAMTSLTFGSSGEMQLIIRLVIDSAFKRTGLPAS